VYGRASRAADRLCRAVELLCAAVLAAMTVVIAVLILTRNLMGFSFAWSEELTRFLLVWLSMLGAAVLLRRDDHIRLDLLADRLPPRARAALSLLLRLLVLGFLVILVQQSWAAALARGATRAPALGLSMTWPYLAIPAAAVMMVLVTLVNLWGDARRLLGRAG
jgi:TRAP-type transport system small permease protein